MKTLLVRLFSAAAGEPGRTRATASSPGFKPTTVTIAAKQ
jgi:hypothetical protein